MCPSVVDLQPRRLRSRSSPVGYRVFGCVWSPISQLARWRFAWLFGGCLAVPLAVRVANLTVVVWQSANMNEVTSQWDADYVDVDQELLFELILVGFRLPPDPQTV